MIIGTGIDIVELARIEKLMNSKNKFFQRILTEKERAIYEGLTERRKIEYLAGRFAAKEAYSKALGTGIGSKLSFQDIEILADANGRPVISSPSIPVAHLSISHSKEYAIAQVIVESLSS